MTDNSHLCDEKTVSRGYHPVTYGTVERSKWILFVQDPTQIFISDEIFKPAKAGFINFILNDNEYTTTYYIMYLLLHGLTLLLSISLLKYNKIMDFFTETDLKS